MITESSLQPLLALIFAAGGAIAYIPMIILGWLPTKKRLPVLTHILEGVWGLLFCMEFIAVSHIAYDGCIKYFTVLCYLIGSLASAAFLKLPIERLAKKLHGIIAQRRAAKGT